MKKPFVVIGLSVIVALLLAALSLVFIIRRGHRQPEQVEKAKPALKQPTPKKPTSKKIVPKYAPGKVYGPVYGSSLRGVLVIIDPGHGGSDPGTHWKFRGETFYEAAYTYKLAAEVGEMIRREGGSIAFTATSTVMDLPTSPRKPLPLPRDAKRSDGKAVSSEYLSGRASLATYIFHKYGNRYHLYAFISLHVDAPKKGWKGLHACYDRRTTPPRLAVLMKQAIVENHYPRQEEHRGIVRPLNPRGLAVLNGNHNALRQRVLLECGKPGDPGDSWRLRNESNRKLMLGIVVVEPLITLNKETKARITKARARPSN